MRPLREKLASDEKWQATYRKIEICPSRIVEHILNNDIIYFRNHF